MKTIKRILYWLSRLFDGSVRVEGHKKPLVSRGGIVDETKLVKRSEAPKRGKFIINVSYRTNWFWLIKGKSYNDEQEAITELQYDIASCKNTIRSIKRDMEIISKAISDL